MAATPTYSTFAGFQAVGGHMTLSYGASPSTGVIVTPAMEVAPTVTDLVLTHGATTVRFPDTCVVKSNYFRRGGHYMRHLVCDKRWKWRQATIGGRYNRRRADGEVAESDKKTTRELFELLFDAVGESSPDLSQVPTGTFFEVDWGSESNVAAQMDLLAQRLGLRICPTTTGGYAVFPVGGGPDLPVLDSMTNSDNAIEHEKPKYIQVVCGPTEYQNLWVLQALALESDNSWVELDDASYKPTGGWESIHPESMQGVDSASHELAIRSVYRAYQLDQLANGGKTIPGYDGAALESIDQILPLREGLLDSGDDWATDFTLSKSEDVRGVFATDNLIQENTASADVEYTGPFDVNRDHGMFLFDRPVFKIDSHAYYSLNEIPAEPWLYARITHTVRDDDGKVDALVVRRDIGGPSGVRSMQRPDLVRRVTQEYATTGALTNRLGTWSPTTLADNQSDIESEAELQLDQMEQMFTEGKDIEYPGIAPVNLTGKIAQVRWDWGHGEAAKTRASTFEFDWHSASADERIATTSMSVLQSEVLKL